jgi:hypothetical protein
MTVIYPLSLQTGGSNFAFPLVWPYCEYCNCNRLLPRVRERIADTCLTRTCTRGLFRCAVAHRFCKKITFSLTMKACKSAAAASMRCRPATIVSLRHVAVLVLLLTCTLPAATGGVGDSCSKGVPCVGGTFVPLLESFFDKTNHASAPLLDFHGRNLVRAALASNCTPPRHLLTSQKLASLASLCGLRACVGGALRARCSTARGAGRVRA